MKTFRIGCGLLACVGASWAQQYIISTVAGGAPPNLGAPLATPVGSPGGIAKDTAGSVYFTSLNCVVKLDQNGVLTRVAGNSRSGYSGDGGAAVNAQLSTPKGLAVDGLGNIFIADANNNRIRKVSVTGLITTVAGSGPASFSGDGGAAVKAFLSNPNGVAVDPSGNLFIADTDGSRIRKVSTSGIITTVAGDGSFGYSGDGGAATEAQLLFPSGVAVDGSGNLFIADAFNNRIRKVSTSGIITTVAGNGTSGYSGDGAAAINAQFAGPGAVVVDGSGNLFIADTGNSCIRKVSTNGIVTTVAGNGAAPSGDGGPPVSAPNGVAVDESGNIFISDTGNSRIRKVSNSGILTTVAGSGVNFSADGGVATNTLLIPPYGVAIDRSGNLFISDAGSRVRKVSPGGIITTVAGTGTPGYSGDGGAAANAQLNTPYGVAVDGSGNLFIADSLNNRIRKVSPSGIITTVAGSASGGFSGDGAAAINAQLNGPSGVAVDGPGNLFIADAGNFRIRKVAVGGIVTTVAGNGTPGFSGDGAAAANAQINFPYGIAVDGPGNLFIADDFNYRVRKVSTNGIITTVAGNGTPGISGDGGPATIAQLGGPFGGVAVDGLGNLFIADNHTNRVRKISTDGIITTLAGDGTRAYSGDGGASTSARLNAPYGVAVDGSGNVYVSDQFNSAVRLLTPTSLSVLISAVVDAASEAAGPVSPGKIVVIYGGGLGPAQLVQNQPGNGVFGTQVAGTTVSFNGIPAPLIYTSATQVAAIVPYEIIPALFATAQVTVSYQGSISSSFTIPLVPSAPSLFTANQTGAGQIATVNALTGVFNDALHPAKAGDFLQLFATGEGQTTPGGVDGKLATTPYPTPNLPVSVTVGGIPATVTYKGGAPTEVAGLMQINIQIPPGVQPGGYVPIVLTVGNTSTTAGALWIAVAAN